MPLCRSPHGERGLKLFAGHTTHTLLSRSPHGERGLKLECRVELNLALASLSSRRAWIEIYTPASRPCRTRSLSSRRAWIEIRLVREFADRMTRRSPHGERGLKLLMVRILLRGVPSLSSRRAWIEIVRNSSRTDTRFVALLTESVD